MNIDNISPEIAQLYTLLKEYSFDVEAYQTDAVIAGWLQEFDLIWVSHAITEALYQGRYKIVSVEHILKLWQRRGQPIRHFNREFETIILGQSLLFYPDPSPPVETRALLPKQVVADPQQEITSGAHNVGLNQSSGPSLPVTLSGARALQDGTPSPSPVSAEFAPVGSTLGTDVLTTWFQSDLPVPNFQPTTPPRWLDIHNAGPIQPFVPRQEVSAMHQRLKAVVDAGSQN